MKDDLAVKDPKPPANPPVRARLALAGSLAAALVVLAAALLWAALNLRRSITAEITDRAGETLDSVATALYLEDQQSGETLASLEDPAEQLQLGLKMSRLRDVIGVRFFASDGKFVNAFPAYVAEATLQPGDLPKLRSLQPVNHFLPRARLEEQELLPETNSPAVPLLLANVPLRSDDQSRLAGIVQFIMSGSSLARQNAAVDRQLTEEFTVAFVVASGLLSGVLALAFGRLQRANRLLAQRTADLLHANRELTLAAKTSAVGAVTSYLIHGLKNPLSGLQNFVRARGAGSGPLDTEEWEAAAASTQRMQDLINRVVGVLQQQITSAAYELSFPELGELLASRMRPAAEAAAVRWQTTVSAAGSLSSRQADLVLLILENLAQNAIEATPAGKTVTCSIVSIGAGVVARISDEGPGLPAEARERLFSPCRSSKRNGSGIGLAISQQLAKQLGADLRLAASTAQGTCFELEFQPAATATGFAAATLASSPAVK